jgi:AcrR family transcriptional regulator
MRERKRKDDRRASRTRRSLSGVLIQLIQEKHYDAITVQDVIDRADVGRSTFYAHYRDKEDLLRSNWEKVLDGFAHQIRWENVSEGRVVPVLELFSHVREFQSFCKGLTRSRKMESILKTGTSYLTMSIEQSLSSLLIDKPQPPVSAAILSNHLASTIFSLLNWWLDHNMPCPPEHMDEVFHKLVMPGVRAALAGLDAGAFSRHPHRRSGIPA